MQETKQPHPWLLLLSDGAHSGHQSQLVSARQEWLQSSTSAHATLIDICITILKDIEDFRSILQPKLRLQKLQEIVYSVLRVPINLTPAFFLSHPQTHVELTTHPKWKTKDGASSKVYEQEKLVANCIQIFKLEGIVVPGTAPNCRQIREVRFTVFGSNQSLDAYVGIDTSLEARMRFSEAARAAEARVLPPEVCETISCTVPVKNKFFICELGVRFLPSTQTDVNRSGYLNVHTTVSDGKDRWMIGPDLLLPIKLK